MPFPTDEEVRAAVELVVHNTLAHSGGDWYATVRPGQPDELEIEFSPRESGGISIDLCLDDDELENLPDDQPAEKTIRLRVRVELVQ